MHQLANRHVIVGITGGIAAYKACELIRRLRDADAEVRVIMTRAAVEFITPLTLQALSGNPVHRDLLDEQAEAAMGHIELARWADLLLVVPATADFMARLGAGMADDLLTTTCLATDAPIALAPAMNQAMWRDPATQHNRQRLQQRGIHLFGPDQGSQACGDTGPGRMLEPTTIAERAAQLFDNGPLSGKRVLLTAGPTREAIDPVRYISNHSSGKMGYALAAAAAQQGACVTLVSGPTALACPRGVARIDVISAEDMRAAVMAHAEEQDIFIATAAVADYRPDTAHEMKIKKNASTLTLSLVRNPDILAEVAALERRPYTVGFAAETHDVLHYARSKLNNKRLDMIVANDVSKAGIGFNSDDNEVHIVTPTTEHPAQRGSKNQLARLILDKIASELTHKVRPGT